MSQNEHVRYASEVLSTHQHPDPAVALGHAKKLKGERPALARLLLSALGDDIQPAELRLDVKQTLAYCTYKDEDSPAPHRFDVALDILKNFCELETTRDPETVGLAGAIYKRLWNYTGRREDLERALEFYSRGHAEKPADNGWAALNTAFVLDLLARQERKSGDSTRTAEADRLRRQVLDTLTQQQPAPVWWYYSSLSEAAIGLGEMAVAEDALMRGMRDAKPSPIDEESTVRQLATIVRLRFDEKPDEYAAAVGVLTRAFGIGEIAVQAMVAGKVGLALSGGGFRASLFHIGVLAKLAELDLLRYVEVLSCVSGGSIVGAFYYLELKKRLEKGPLTRKDFIELVRDVERKFLEGVQKNIRTAIAANPLAGLRMALQPGYSRSDRIGALYEKHLYDQVPDEGEKKARLMSDLKVDFKHWPDFNPKYHNWKLDAKVPILVLNATTLNTGHNWQYTATWMGESPQANSAAIDTIPRLRRRYYTETWDENGEEKSDTKDIRLGSGVGASACVPGLFEPIVMRRFYDERTVRLVDGGVHDNQGLGSLIEQGCRIMLVSDSSGQMSEEENPNGAATAALGRSSSISQARVREAQFHQLQTLYRSGAIEGSMFIHLTKDLEAAPVSWTGAPAEVKHTEPGPVTSYGVDREIQLKLSKVRTDLDSFSDAEAYALMTSGYLMAHQALVVQQCAPTLPIHDQPESWAFLGTKDALTQPGTADNTKMKHLLAASNQLTGRIWRQWLPLKILGGAIALGALVALAFLVRWMMKTPNATLIPAVTSKWVLSAATFVIIAVIFRYAMDKLFHYQKRFGEFFLGIALATVGCVAAWVHLLIFDKIFLWYGRWAKAPELPIEAVAGGPRMRIRDAAAPAAVSADVPRPPAQGERPGSGDVLIER